MTESRSSVPVVAAFPHFHPENDSMRTLFALVVMLAFVGRPVAAQTGTAGDPLILFPGDLAENIPAVAWAVRTMRRAC